MANGTKTKVSPYTGVGWNKTKYKFKTDTVISVMLCWRFGYLNTKFQ